MAASKPPAFQLYVKDWMSSTALMSLEAQGAYLRLLCWSWDNGPLPKSEDLLARVLGLTMARFRRVWTELAAKWVATEIGLVNSRLEQQRDELNRFKEYQSERGKQGAEKRWGRHAPANGVAMPQAMAEAQPKHSSSSSSSSSTAKIKTVARASDDALSAFEVFWRRYPNRKGKQAALKAWIKLAPSADLISAIGVALDWQITQPQWVKNGGAYVPHASTWLNGRRFEDEPFHVGGDATDEAWERVLGKVEGHGHRS